MQADVQFGDGLDSRRDRRAMPNGGMFGERGRQWVGFGVAFVVQVAIIVALTERGDPLSTELTTLLFWDVFGVAWLGLTVLAVRHRSPAALRDWAVGVQSRRRQWRDRFLGREVGVGFPGWAAAYGFIAGVWALPQAADLEPEHSTLLTVVSVAAVVISWFVLHGSFALYYAYEYYRASPPGGLDFPGDHAPTFGEFAYFSVMVAATFGTTDVDIVARSIRRSVLLHALLGFVFNTGVLALTLTLLAG